MILEIAKYSLAVIGIIMLLGGVFGYRRAKSKASLIAGIGSSILLALACGLSFSYPLIGILSGFVVLCCLDVVFVIRVLKTRVIMPGGMLLILCLIEQVILILGLMNLSG
jgi:uncharacterized membrane protein (UPF0136 family)